MTTRISGKSMTFVVDSVEPTKDLLPVWKTGEGIRNLLSAVDGSPPMELLSWSGYNSFCVAKIFYHPFLAAVHTAFSEHRALVLSPDMIWITIVQGLAQHVKNNAEKLRHKLVNHLGKQTIAIARDDIFESSPESAWDSAINDLSEVLARNLGGKYDALISDFSTTGDLERTVCQIALLDTFEPYFDYRVYSGCGIPAITLEGNPSDWRRLRAKVEALSDYEVDWWLVHLRPVLDQFERAAAGDVDLRHWQDIYKRREAYGPDRINGWIVKLIPYVKDHTTSVFTRPNPVLLVETREGSKNMQPTPAAHEPPQPVAGWPGDGGYVSIGDLPSGISLVPFTLISQGREIAMQFLGGFVGIQQQEDTVALRPTLGWAVRKAPQGDWLPDDLGDQFQVFLPLAVSEFNRRVTMLNPPFRPDMLDIPNDFANFYRQCDGIEYRDPNSGRTAKVRSLKEMTVCAHPFPDDATSDAALDDLLSAGARWITVADLLDGSRIAFQISSWHDEVGPICKIMHDGSAKQLPARTFIEFVREFISQRGQL